MKKIVVLFAFLIVGQSVFAAVDSQYMKTDKFLYNIGYSKEMSKMIATHAEDPYRDNYVEEKNFPNIMRRIYHYVVPGQETNLDFYNHSGDFNGWSWKDY